MPILALSFLLFLSCGNNKTENPEQKRNARAESDTIPAVYRKPPSSFNDTFIIRGDAAVFFNPDTLQLENIKLARKKMDFESDSHDCFFQQRNARMVLKKQWSGVKIIETSKARFLLFIQDNGTRTLIDLDTKNDMCGIFLFNGKKEPELADMMNIDSGLEYYFRK